ncbi:thioredoxin-like protein [Cystoisospora suis]|uniref:Thioredoxin-like protein n=1 Tax=Cystoisospora suis TaxID=483139 RepID=A0A2C6L3N3_9APIC|nr:thioredoxin-like protein [Cystoisospora suis]
MRRYFTIQTSRSLLFSRGEGRLHLRHQNNAVTSSTSKSYADPSKAPTRALERFSSEDGPRSVSFFPLSCCPEVLASSGSRLVGSPLTQEKYLCGLLSQSNFVLFPVKSSRCFSRSFSSSFSSSTSPGLRLCSCREVLRRQGEEKYQQLSLRYSSHIGKTVKEASATAMNGDRKLSESSSPDADMKPESENDLKKKEEEVLSMVDSSLTELKEIEKQLKKETDTEEPETGGGGKKKRSAFFRWCKWLLMSSFVLAGGSAVAIYLAFPSTPPDTWSPLRSFLIEACERASDLLAKLRLHLLSPAESRKDKTEEKKNRGQEETSQGDPSEAKSVFSLFSKNPLSGQRDGGGEQGEELSSSSSSPALQGFSLVTDAEFDRTDEALVLFVDNEAQADKVKDKIVALRKKVHDLQEERNLTKHLKLFYAFRTPLNSPSQGDEPSVLLYKGQRRSRHTLDDLLLADNKMDQGDSLQSTSTQEGHVSEEGERKETMEKENKPEDKMMIRDGVEDILLTFFKPVSEKQDKRRRKIQAELHLPQQVTGETFQADVLGTAKDGHPILLQLFEDSCFLCFLMRPFINSVSQILAEHGIPVEIKRLNIEKNDFPPGCPVTRATPTFVLYRSENGEKWTEFKPKDFIERLEKEFSLPPEVRLKFNDLLETLHDRFRRFGLLSVWLLEQRKMEREMMAVQQQTQKEMFLDQGGEASALESVSTAGPSSSDSSWSSTGSEPPSNSNSHTDQQTEVKGGPEDFAGRSPVAHQGEDKKKKEDEDFDAIVSMLMSQDMKRDDNLPQNLEHLEKEILNAEADTMVFGVMMGEELLRRDVEYLADALLGSAETETAPSSSSSRPREKEESSESKQNSQNKSSRRMDSLTT